jgi:hypothetical protein
MSDLFISYAREDRDTAQALADVLQEQGLAVWWDRELTGGGDFAQEIETQLRAAPLVLVLWSPASVQSDFVRDESARARDLKKLLPVRIAPVDLPLGFGTLNTLDLLDWQGDADDEPLQQVLAQVRARLAAGPGASAQAVAAQLQGEAEGALTRRRQRRQWLLAALTLGGAATVGGGAWVWRRDQRQAEARDRLDLALKFHLGQPPEPDRARTAYSEAARLDPTLARAYYFWAHLLVQQMLEARPPLPADVLNATRLQAKANFEEALHLARADGQRLEGSQRLIAEQQLGALSAQDVAPPVARSVTSGAGSVGADVPDRPALAAASAASTDMPAPVPAAVAEAVPSPARAQALALFAADRDTRLAATSALTLDPARAADALPVVVQQAGELLQAGSLTAAQWQGMASALALLDRASPATLQRLQQPITALLSQLQGQASPDPGLRASALALQQRLLRSAQRAPLAYLQIAHERQRPVAQALARELVKAGYRTPAIENTGEARAPARPSVRSQGASDPALARWCQQALGRAVGRAADLVTLRQATPDNDVFELWFDRALCAPGGRAVPGCVDAA